ncbi:helix-turn-helix transcriptional regulator [Vibrio harveyi]|uniref:XRE family transcriptional regulator n=1 Tax=Vibrio harveyi group TaxID=717610 RepID=UPI000971B531|nr:MULTISPECIES: XRE family transcriptional regulator [Vibrio harveyi group]ELY1989207.1 helix-turn-helix transcriptional regulator [Vibrio harveyi]APX10095.1 hypothetical protein BWP24_28310 [Vibrio campbellii]ARR10499.1 Peptidase S24-like [Vibrio campbellii]WCP78859.1 XRE family transcriptional regulator [Vibrio parahaemolyticus]WHP52946.1 XRE family transcriptional regulator [Vibrio parahaemolyticus]
MSELSKAVIGERIKQARKKIGMKQKDLAEALPVTPQAVSGWERGVTTPQVELYDPLAAILGESKNRLFFDKELETKQETENDIFEVPFYNKEVAPDSETEKYPLPTKFIRTNVDFNNLVMACVNGDAMNPIIPDGSLTAIDTSSKSIVDGRIYLIRVKSFFRVKALSVESGRIKIKSLNEDYPDEYANIDDENSLEIIGKAVWISSNLL